MKISSWPFARQIAGFLILLLAMPVAAAAQEPGRQNTAGQQAQSAPADNAQKSGSAAAVKDANGDASAETAAPAPAYAGAGDPQQGQSAAPGAAAPSSGQERQQQNSSAKPVGTAAASETNAAGVAGSRLTGAVIAPAKQRRVHTILIRVAVVVGACVAIGTVAALSHSSPSQPR